ncbi:MAG: hypothetical protein ACPGU5_01065 [Lishizhenia sp.]
MSKVKLILSVVLLAAVFGCTKNAGEGGSSSIIGKVFVENYNAAGILQESYYGPEEDVFIIYGNASNTYDDDFKTSFDGSYKFEYLAKGEYTVFAYSECDDCESGVEVVSQTVTINENKTEFELPDLVVRR